MNISIPPVENFRPVEHCLEDQDQRVILGARKLCLALEITDTTRWTEKQRVVLWEALIEGKSDHVIAREIDNSHQNVRRIIRDAWHILQGRVPGLVNYRSVEWHKLKAGRPRKKLV